jgi:outer membrane protein insertion porin family
MAGPVQNTVRTWDHDSNPITPQIAFASISNDPIGALNMVVFNTEFLYPLSKALGLRAAAFFDVGKGWGGGTTRFDNSFWPLRYAAGAGIRWYSPFGPIRVDWGYNLSPKEGRGEKSNVWDFSMGTMF